jgi:putative salt-induced outer membrane protein
MKAVPFCLLLCLSLAAPAVAQPPAPAPAPAPAAAPPPPWTGNAGLGLSLNRGNTDTTNFNMSYEVTHDPKTASVWKFKGLYLRGETSGDVTANQVLLDNRYEHTFTPRVYGFGSLQFLRDPFKAIDWLWAPSGGVGYKLVAAPMTTLNVDAGLGVKIEKNPGTDSRTDAVVTMSDKFEHKLSKVSSISQSFGALWKAQDFGDALYTFTAGVAGALTPRTQLKLELLDTYATRPPTVDVKSNDVSLITALVFKF